MDWDAVANVVAMFCALGFALIILVANKYMDDGEGL
jgi:hypothetical protein